MDIGLLVSASTPRGASAVRKKPFKDPEAAFTINSLQFFLVSNNPVHLADAHTVAESDEGISAIFELA